MAEKKNKKYGAWFVVVLILIGLAGFGTGGLSGNMRSLGSVGEKDVSVFAYQSTLNDRIRALSAQAGQAISFQQAQAFGIDRLALSQLILTRTLDNEATQLGLSAGDENVLARLQQIPDFNGAGGFNRESYRFALERTGQNETQFENGIREELARGLLQDAVVGGIPSNDVYAQTLLSYIAERRDVTWAVVDQEFLTAPVPGATEADQQAYYEANPDEFTLPETRDITYAWLKPAMLQDDMDVPDAAIEQLYQERINQFVQPERRLVERLVYISNERAEEAKARLDAGEVTFEDLVVERGLGLADIDLGDVAQDDLGNAGEAVFAAAPGAVVGPFNADLGPALFRMNAILAAQETTLEEAAPDLREELAADAAREVINGNADQIIDLLAGGASMEDLAERTDMELGTINWTPETTDGIAAYDSFRQAAANATEGDFPELENLSDGGVFALRLDGVTPPTVQPFDEVQEDVMAAWQEQARQDAIIARAEEIAPDIAPLTAFGTLDLTANEEPDMTRRTFIEGTPPDFNEQVFEMNMGEVRVLDAEDRAIIVRLDNIAPADPEDETNVAQLQAFADDAAAGLAQDIFDAYADAVQQRTDVSINQAAVNAVNAQFR
ncbi:peptidylprolyl isomerase [Yoonia sp. 2307UL14-13]|uniref:peptidylprolyl isomerase n=1 Tax=Yoonia sp. 2307UL14-13 TaxID=3126506 RepID=UPI0030B2FB41